MKSVNDSNTSAQQRAAMRRIAPDNPVRRCLFPVDNLDEQARNENFQNNFKENFARDAKEKREKWNFDFKEEVALHGVYEWYKQDGDKFVRMEPQSENMEPSDKVSAMQIENESTPRSVKEDIAPRLRKRRNNLESKVGCQSVKRKISYD